jgi:multiple antibiotic resistance protein
MDFLGFAIVAISSLIAIMEPFSTTAIFMGLTDGMDGATKRKIISKSMMVSAVVLIFFAFTGNLIFTLFGFTISAFEIAGGILLITVALRMLNPEESGLSSYRAGDIAIVPLAMPLTCGPGTITAVILLTSQASGLPQIAIVYVGIIIGIAISFFALLYSSRLSSIMGKDGLRIITALMSIIILAIAVQFMINGIEGAIRLFLAA